MYRPTFGDVLRLSFKDGGEPKDMIFGTDVLLWMSDDNTGYMWFIVNGRLMSQENLDEVERMIAGEDILCKPHNGPPGLMAYTESDLKELGWEISLVRGEHINKATITPYGQDMPQSIFIQYQ